MDMTMAPSMMQSAGSRKETSASAVPAPPDALNPHVIRAANPNIPLAINTPSDMDAIFPFPLNLLISRFLFTLQIISHPPQPCHSPPLQQSYKNVIYPVPLGYVIIEINIPKSNGR